jgi:hypothetical protein
VLKVLQVHQELLVQAEQLELQVLQACQVLQVLMELKAL